MHAGSGIAAVRIAPLCSSRVALGEKRHGQWL